MSAAFTPGPWRLDPPSSHHVTRGPDSDGYHVVEAGDGTNMGRYRGFWIAQFIAEPDAQLIASAPDMFAVLVEALEFVEDHEDVVDGPDGQPQPNRAMALALTLRRAIAKATGEQA